MGKLQYMETKQLRQRNFCSICKYWELLLKIATSGKCKRWGNPL